MAVFLIIFSHEIKLLMQNLHKIYANLLFFVISVVTFLIIVQGLISKDFEAFYVMAIILFSITSSLIFSSSEFLKDDFDDGTLEQMIAKIDNFEIFIFAKILANWFVKILPIILFCPLIIEMSNVEIDIFNMMVFLVISSVAISFIANFCGSLAIISNLSSVISILIMPLLIPILLICYDGIFNQDSSMVKVLLAISTLAISSSVLATAKLVKIFVE